VPGPRAPQPSAARAQPAGRAPQAGPAAPAAPAGSAPVPTSDLTKPEDPR
jgi:ABC-2 type transport system ATP-binding protein